MPYFCFTCVLSCVRPFATLWTVACQACPSMEFPRWEYWSGLPLSTPGDLPDPDIKPWVFCISCIGGWILYHLSHLGSPCLTLDSSKSTTWNKNLYANSLFGRLSQEIDGRGWRVKTRKRGKHNNGYVNRFIALESSWSLILLENWEIMQKRF